MRLRHSKPGVRGYRRVHAGHGFSYRDAQGSTVRDPELRERFDALAIPPAWRQVWISEYENGHILAVGYDAAERKQYIYHPKWREQKDRIKFDRALQLAESLPTARRQVTIHLRESGMTRNRALAAAFRMLDTGSLRVGSTRYADANGSHGLTTLLCSHVRVRGTTIELRFPAKSNKAWESDITDPDLATFVKLLKRRGPTAHLLSYLQDGVWHALNATDVNDYVRERTGGDFTAKDFRTLHGTAAAALSLARHGAEKTRTGRQHAIVQAMRDASEVLSNTPTIARASYVDPRVVDRYEAGETVDPSRPASIESELRALLIS